MKFTALFLMIILSNANAGTFLKSGVYVTKDIVIGFGRSFNMAQTDALKAIPQGYKIDKLSSPAVNCAFKEFPTEKEECATEDVRVEIPVKKE